MSSVKAPRSALIAILLGGVVRVATLSWPGTFDVRTFEIWSHTAATSGVTRIYGEGFPPRPRVLTYAGEHTIVNYPPLAVYELAMIGRASGFTASGGFPNHKGFAIAIKVALTLMDAALAVLIFFAVRSRLDVRAAWWSAAAYWANPAIVLTTTLGYIDVFMAVTAVGALVAAAWGRSSVAGALAAAAMMTKPQAVVGLPAVAVALWNAGAPGQVWFRLLAAMKSGAIVSTLIAAPFLAAGTVPNMLRCVASSFGQDMLSGTACNLWWIVSYLFEVTALKNEGWTHALAVRVRILPMSRLLAMGYPNPRLVGLVFLCVAGGWAVWTARRTRDLALFAALGGFLADAYFMLSPQVHENHFFLILPLLVIASVAQRQFLPILAASSGLFFLNLYLFYGFTGAAPPPVFRAMTAIDSTVLVSVLAGAALAWYGITLRRACLGESKQGRNPEAVNT
jgi:hypothetical protein